MAYSSLRWLTGLALLAAVAGATWWWRLGSPPPGGKLTPGQAEEAARAYLNLEARERSVEAVLWAPEVDAAGHEDELLRWWDALNQAADPWAVLEKFPIELVDFPRLEAKGELPDGTEVWRLNPGGASMDSSAWLTWLRRWPGAGWTLHRTTWALTGHEPGTDSRSARSLIRLTAQLENPGAALRGSLNLQGWMSWKPGERVPPEPNRLEIRDGEWLVRQGRPAFRPWLEADIPTDRSIFTDPLLLWDVEGDGFPEICLVGADRIWRNRASADLEGGRTFEDESWLGLPAERIVAALRADVSGDGWDDLVIADGRGVRWWAGQATGGPIRGTPVEAWSAPNGLRHPQVMTAGDFDGDGDPDLWLAQYKLPYQGGQFPTPWDDANDGFPSFLLRNDGQGRFVDVTGGSGLEAKRFRRTYSASFIDLDLDGDLDLVNISDFAGLDVFLNQGRGVFADVTGSLGVARHAFGMSHVVTDLNRDGRPDLLMLGMNSTVADRIGYLGLERVPGDRARMREMTVGNRLFLGTAGEASLVPAPAEWGRGLVRTGWTWGAAWADFNGDGAADLAVANGHETRASVRDYERQFWRHDRFVAGSANSPVADLYFRTASGRRQADQASYGGWQNNALLLNSGRNDWAEVAWLWGVAVPQDSRNLLAEDLDADGRPDLVVTTQEEWPKRRQRLLVFRNKLPVGDWVGSRWSGPFPSGARVELETSTGRQAQWCLTGDGYRSQGSAAWVFAPGSGRPVRLLVHRPGRPTLMWPISASRSWELLGGGGPSKVK